MISKTSLYLVASITFLCPLVATAQVEINGLTFPARLVEFTRIFGHPDSSSSDPNSEYLGDSVKLWYSESQFDVFADSSGGYVEIEEIRLEKSPDWKIKLYGHSISSKSSYNELRKIFKRKLWKKQTYPELQFKDESELLSLHFRKKKLVSIELRDPG